MKAKDLRERRRLAVYYPPHGRIHWGIWSRTQKYGKNNRYKLYLLMEKLMRFVNK